MTRPLVVLALGVLFLSAACRRGPAPRITLQNVERCELGVDLAGSQPTQLEMGTIFFRECSDTFAEPLCRQGFLDASAAPHVLRTATVLKRCAEAYCPLFPDRKLAACDPALVMTPLAAAFVWPPLHEAILERDASGYAPRLRRSFLTHDRNVASKPPTPP